MDVVCRKWSGQYAWPSRPLKVDAVGNLPIVWAEEIEPGRNITAHAWCGFLSDVPEHLSTGRAFHDRHARYCGSYLVYLPTAADLSTAAELFANCNGCPPWSQIVAELIATGRPPEELAALPPVAVLRLIAGARRKEIPPLSVRQFILLKTLRELRATTADTRRTTAEVVQKAEGKHADPEQFKRDVSSLHDAGFLETKKGRGGGCWLTATGCDIADRLS